VYCAGKVKYLLQAWVSINMLRRSGSKLPIQIWHFGPEEVDEHSKVVFKSLNVTWVDINEVVKLYPMDNLRGWECKPFAIVHCSFKEVLFIDADNVPVKNPEFLFNTPEFKQFGALFWPDRGRYGPDRSAWGLLNIQYRDEPEFESGQILVDKERCWQALMVALWLNEHSDFYYGHMHGDKETYHFGWRRTNTSIFMCPPMVECQSADYSGSNFKECMCQHDPSNNRIFQHRNYDKWKLDNSNKTIVGFQLESECKSLINEFRERINRHDEVLNIHLIEDNVGDLASAPIRYFSLPKISREFNINNLDVEYEPDRNYIIGGGGLLHNIWLDRIKKLLEKPNSGKTIIWGIGLNFYNDNRTYPDWIKLADLVGVRDYNVGLRWVPCASCMHPSFDKVRVPTTDVVLYEHRQIRTGLKGLPTMSNGELDLDKVLNFLGSGEVVVTNSYHGAYWATLLGRGVIVYRPFSSKFYYMRHQPVLVDSFAGSVGDVKKYPEALSECRKANVEFFNDVVRLLGHG
jgi:hypothetical protein